MYGVMSQQLCGKIPPYLAITPNWLFSMFGLGTTFKGHKDRQLDLQTGGISDCKETLSQGSKDHDTRE